MCIYSEIVKPTLLRDIVEGIVEYGEKMALDVGKFGQGFGQL